MNANAKIVMDGATQVIRLPDDIHLDGQEATVKQDGNRLIIDVVKVALASKAADLKLLFAHLDAHGGADFLSEGIESQPPMPDGAADLDE